MALEQDGLFPLREMATLMLGPMFGFLESLADDAPTEPMTLGDRVKSVALLAGLTLLLLYIGCAMILPVGLLIWWLT